MTKAVSRSRLKVFCALAAVAVGVFVAVSSGIGAATTTGGVAAANAVRLQTVTHAVRIDGVVVHVTAKSSGAVCYSAPHVSRCASSLDSEQLSYGTGRAGRHVVLAGVAGAGVRAVIARLSRGGTVWQTLHAGAFYVLLPRGYRLRTIVKVLSGGRRVAYRAA